MNLEILKKLFSDPEGSKDEIIEYMRDLVSSQVPHNEIIEDGQAAVVRYGYGWTYGIKEFLNNPEAFSLEEIKDEIGNLKGACLFDKNSEKTFEFGIDFVYNPDILYRVPVGYTLSYAGVYKGKENLCLSREAIYPTGLLLIDNGRFPCFYHLRNIVSQTNFVEDTLSKHSSPRYTAEFTEYILKFLKVNMYSPAKITPVKF